MQLREGALEFHGGFSTWYMRRVARASAMTLGHVILGRDEWCLQFCREHEQAHVRQVEIWGPFFIPAYLGSSALECALAWTRRGPDATRYGVAMASSRYRRSSDGAPTITNEPVGNTITVS